MMWEWNGRNTGEKMEGGESIKNQFYFAYGSNMNLDQMEYRCPAARVVETVRLEDHRLAFCGRPEGNGVATIFPEEGSQVEGVLWEITPGCEKSLDGYEGYPYLYGKQTVRVRNQAGMEMDVMAYVMNAPYKETLSSPSRLYLDGILEGCRQNGIPEKPVRDAAAWTKKEKKKKRHKDPER